MAQSAFMTVLEHLGELRRRIIRSAIVFLLATMFCFYYGYEPVKLVLVAPLEALNANTKNPFSAYNPLVRRLRPQMVGPTTVVQVRLNAMTPWEPFMVKFNISMLGALVISSPFLFYQLWAFIGAGLRPGEKSVVLRYLPLSLALFIAGMLFAYLVALPIAMLYLLTVDPEINLVLMYAPYMKLIIKIMAAFGLVFQLPLVMMALARLGLVQVKTMTHYRRHAIVGLFITAALLAPSPDPFSMCLLAIPMIALYEFGILLSKLAEKRMAAAHPA
ncbi:MAG: twin-arginine translocase subunit TatC [Candidatus Brocadiia bacterium]|jgi:sec-independent protein translocase protein TatC